ncbi:MAG: hypothetical protein NC350_03035 [Corallococcus sp.]|nr:hypothetical protein [Corallococcus sp.]
MKVKDVLYEVNAYLQLNLPEYYFKDSARALSDAQCDSTVSMLLRCLNYILDELRTDAFPDICEESANAADGKIFYDELKFKPLEIISVKDTFGTRVKFRQNASCVKVEFDGAYCVKYAKKGENAEFDGEIDLPTAKVTAAVLAEGVCAEYCFLRADYEGASAWDDKYRKNIDSTSVRRGKRLPQRRWL